MGAQNKTDFACSWCERELVLTTRALPLPFIWSIPPENTGHVCSFHGQRVRQRSNICIGPRVGRKEGISLGFKLSQATSTTTKQKISAKKTTASNSMLGPCISVRTTRCSLGQCRRMSKSRYKSFKTSEPSPPQVPTEAEWAAIEPTHLTFFHHAANDLSVQLLKVFRDAQLCFPSRDSPYGFRYRGPLKLELDVKEENPSVDDFRNMLPMTADMSFRSFMDQDKRRHAVTNPQALAELVEKDPTMLAWPIIVDWDHEQLCIGGVNFRTILNQTLQRRSAVIRPAKPEPKPEPEPRWIPPPEDPWKEYD
ncbi:hypothetical protein C8R43DRAFT_258803 [Mycena crocata]|nr:hypothetical protein C8R43DRAFT_258803 [Mycena crocata]